MGKEQGHIEVAYGQKQRQSGAYLDDIQEAGVDRGVWHVSIADARAVGGSKLQQQPTSAVDRAELLT